MAIYPRKSTRTSPNTSLYMRRIWSFEQLQPLAWEFRIKIRHLIRILVEIGTFSHSLKQFLNILVPKVLFPLTFEKFRSFCVLLEVSIEKILRKFSFPRKSHKFSSDLAYFLAFRARLSFCKGFSSRRWKSRPKSRPKVPFLLNKPQIKVANWPLAISPAVLTSSKPRIFPNIPFSVYYCTIIWAAL